MDAAFRDIAALSSEKAAARARGGGRREPPGAGRHNTPKAQWVAWVSAEVPYRECPSRAGLEIPLEVAGVGRVFEPDRGSDTPRSMLRRMRRPTCVVGGQPASQILRQADVALLQVLLGLEQIDDVAAGHARARCKMPTAVAR